MAGLLALGFGLLLIGIGVRALLVERRVARRRPIRPDLVASCTLLFVFGGLAVLLGLAMLLVFPRG